MLEQEAKQIFEKSGALQKGHFKLVSGQHSSTYFQCIRALSYPNLSSKLFSELANRFANDSVSAVIGINAAGIIIAYNVAERLNARLIVAEQIDKAFSLMRGFHISPHERVLIVDDVTTTGGTLIKLIELVITQGGNVVGTGLIATKGLVRLNLGYKTEILVPLEGMDAFKQQECPLCASGVPLDN